VGGHVREKEKWGRRKNVPSRGQKNHFRWSGAKTAGGNVQKKATMKGRQQYKKTIPSKQRYKTRGAHQGKSLGKRREKKGGQEPSRKRGKKNQGRKGAAGRTGGGEKRVNIKKVLEAEGRYIGDALWCNEGGEGINQRTLTNSRGKSMSLSSRKGRQ